MPAPIHDETDFGLAQAQQSRGLYSEQRKPGDPAGIRFDTENVGGWLHIETTEVDDDGKVMLIVNSVYGDTYWYPSGVGQDQGGEWWLYGDSGSFIGLYSGGGIDLGGPGRIAIGSTDANVEIDADDQILIGTNGEALNVVIGTNTGSFNFVKLVGSDRDILVGSQVIVTGLPTSDPGVTGALWDDATFLRRSA